MKETPYKLSEENVLGKSETNPILDVKKEEPGLSSEEITKRIEKEEREHEKEIDFRKTKYEKSHKEPIDKQLFDLHIKEENERYHRKIEFLNKIPKNDLN